MSSDTKSRPSCIVNEKDVPCTNWSSLAAKYPLFSMPDVLTNANRYTAQWKSLGAAAGGVQIGCALYDVPANGVAGPFHYHDSNEETIYVLSGSGTVRYGNEFVPIAKGDYAVFTAAGTAADAHQITNSGHENLKYLCFSTNILPEVVTYPDGQKIAVLTAKGGMKLFPLAAEVPYWSGEPVPPANAAAAAAITPAAAMKAVAKPAVATAASAATAAADAKSMPAAGATATAAAAAARPKWIINDSAVEPYTWADMPTPLFEMPSAAIKDSFAFSRRQFGPSNLSGAKLLGASIYDVPAGKAAWPYHFHDVQEEVMYILSGSGTLRLGGQFVPVSSGDYIALKPCTDGSAAHQLINTNTASPLRYLCISTMQEPELTTYPESKKVGVLTGDLFKWFPIESAVPYFHRESAPQSGPAPLPK